MSSPVICDDLDRTRTGATTAAPAGQAAVSRSALLRAGSRIGSVVLRLSRCTASVDLSLMSVA